MSRRVMVTAAVAIALVAAIVGYGVSRFHAPLSKQAIASELARTRLSLESNANTLLFDRNAVAAARERAHSDDWTTYAHDDRRSGLDTAASELTAATVAKLKPRWTRNLHEEMWASPIAAGGRVILATTAGNVYALDPGDGNILWKQHVGNVVHGTPAIADGLLMVSVYGGLGAPGEKPRGAAMVALDPASGAVRWRTEMPGLMRAEPIVIKHVLYTGLAGGDDFSGCFEGRVVAFDTRTGARLPMEWRVSPKPNNGGGVWSPLSTDGETIYFGTGNTCKLLGGDDDGDAIVALTPQLTRKWRVSARYPGVDDSDVGGGVNVAGPLAVVGGKDGFFYTIDRATGHLERRYDLKPWARNGGTIATATGDGDTTVISTGELKSPWQEKTTAQNATGDLVAFDKSGNERYRLHSDYAIHSYVAFVPGIGFAVLDRRLVAFDAKTGAQLWSAPTDDVAYTGPVVVPSGVYVVGNHGFVEAFGLPSNLIAHN